MKKWPAYAILPLLGIAPFFAFAWVVIAACIVLGLFAAYWEEQRHYQSRSVGHESGVYDRWIDR